MVTLFRATLATAAVLCVVSLSSGKTFAPKTDNKIICLDVRSGELLWQYDPGKLSDAHFEWYAGRIVAYPHYNGDVRKNPIALDIDSGRALPPVGKVAGDPLAKSAVFWPGPKMSLENGWRLHGYSSGNTRALQFVDTRGDKVWAIETGGYPHQVRSWKNWVFYAFSYLSDEGILYAYRAGEKKPAWTVDLNKIVTGRRKPLTRMIFQVIDGKIYLEANEHIFCLDPNSGAVLWHRNLASDLGLGFYQGFYGGSLNLAVFAKEGNVLVVSFAKRVVAIDLNTNKYLWHLQPDTFPHTAFPVLRDGKLVLTSGLKRELTRLPDTK